MGALSRVPSRGLATRLTLGGTERCGGPLLHSDARYAQFWCNGFYSKTTSWGLC